MRCAHAGAGASATINQSCSFSISKESFIDIAVVNHNTIMSHSLIGAARVSLDNVLQAGTETMEVNITDKKQYGAGTVELRLEVEQVTLNPPLHIIFSVNIDVLHRLHAGSHDSTKQSGRSRARVWSSDGWYTHSVSDGRQPCCKYTRATHGVWSSSGIGTATVPSGSRRCSYDTLS